MGKLIDDMAAAIRDGTKLPRTPAGLSLDEAYEIQKAVVAAVCGTAVAGFKAGMTAKASQQQFGLTHPLLGPLYAAGRMAPGVSFPGASGILLECEIGVVMDGDGVPKSAGPVIEVPRLLLAEDEDVSGINMVACGIGADRYIAGTQMPLLESYEDIQVTLTRNGETLSSAPATEALGGPLAALNWILGEAELRGFPIADDMLCITGACGGIHPAHPGNYRADYGKLGTVEFTVT